MRVVLVADVMDSVNRIVARYPFRIFVGLLALVLPLMIVGLVGVLRTKRIGLRGGGSVSLRENPGLFWGALVCYVVVMILLIVFFGYCVVRSFGE